MLIQSRVLLSTPCIVSHTSAAPYLHIQPTCLAFRCKRPTTNRTGDVGSPHLVMSPLLAARNLMHIYLFFCTRKQSAARFCSSVLTHSTHQLTVFTRSSHHEQNRTCQFVLPRCVVRISCFRLITSNKCVATILSPSPQHTSYGTVLHLRRCTVSLYAHRQHANQRSQTR